MSIPSNIAIAFRVLFGRLSKLCFSWEVVMWSCSCGTSNKQTMFWTRTGLSRGGSSSSVCGSLVEQFRSNGFWSKGEMPSSAPLEPRFFFFFFLADAYVHVSVYVFVCDLLQSLGRIEKVKASTVIRSWISFFLLSCHSSPLCLPLILLLTPKIKKTSLHIHPVLSAETIYSP